MHTRQGIKKTYKPNKVRRREIKKVKEGKMKSQL